MFIYLTSLASKTLDLLTPFLPEKPEKMTVAFIPTASDLYKEKPWVAGDRDKLKQLGFKVTDIDIKKFSKEKLREKLKDFDVIFVSGGTTTYLLEKSRESGFDEIVKELVKSGTIYIGSSAGSLIAGPTVEPDTIYDHRGLGGKLNSYKGFGLVDFVVLPHADKEKFSLIIMEIIKKFGKRFKLKKLGDSQALLVREKSIKLIDGSS
jgi:dipeptidase E